MRWKDCHCCDSHQDTIRDDKTIVIIFECHCCWQDYCDTCGDRKGNICDTCLDEAYINNYGHPYVVSKDDPMGIESAPEWVKEEAEIIEKAGWYDGND